MSGTWRTPPGSREDLTAQASLDWVGHVKQRQAGLNREADRGGDTDIGTTVTIE